MRCPSCKEEIPARRCPDCGAETPAEGIYCMNCGRRLETVETQAGPEDEDAFDIENRVLCPDGTCTGIIVNGRCTECGRIVGEE